LLFFAIVVIDIVDPEITILRLDLSLAGFWIGGDIGTVMIGDDIIDPFPDYRRNQLRLRLPPK
jgi:hypothetical protein